MLLTGPCCQLDIHQGLVLLDPLDGDMFYRDAGELLQDAPSRGGVDIVKEDDGFDLIQILAVQPPKGGTQL